MFLGEEKEKGRYLERDGCRGMGDLLRSCKYEGRMRLRFDVMLRMRSTRSTVSDRTTLVPVRKIAEADSNTATNNWLHIEHHAGGDE